MSDENNDRKLTTRDEATDFLLHTAPDGQAKVECIHICLTLNTEP